MSTLRAALAERVVVADGAMGTMLQASDATIDDFTGYEGCNEILNITRPDIVTGIHQAYLDAGADCITTNSFGTNLGNLGEYGIADRIGELSEASARVARAAADRSATPDRPRWVLGSIGPGTKLPTLGHTTFRELRDTYQANAEGLLRGGADALIIETCQDLLQAKAAIFRELSHHLLAWAGRHPALRAADPSTRWLFSYGGGGGLLCVEAAEILGIPRVSLERLTSSLCPLVTHRALRCPTVQPTLEASLPSALHPGYTPRSGEQGAPVNTSSSRSAWPPSMPISLTWPKASSARPSKRSPRSRPPGPIAAYFICATTSRKRQRGLRLCARCPASLSR